MSAPTVVIIGGGISGLSAAYYLQKSSIVGRVVVLEASQRLGGWMHTMKFDDGCLFERGPRSLRPVGKAGKNTLRLAEELGLTEDILAVHKTDPAAQNRYLYVNGQLSALPNGIGGLVRKSHPFSRPLLTAVMHEPFACKSNDPDETIYAFVRRRLGKEVANYGADAMCRGIFAADCRQLSMRACFPEIFDMEREHGSLFLGMFKRKNHSHEEEDESPLVRRAKAEKWATWSLKNGLQELSDSLAATIKKNRRCEIRLGEPCVCLVPSLGRLRVKTYDDEIVADYVLSATFAKDLAGCLPDKFSVLRKELCSIPAVSVYVVNLEYSGLAPPLQGFGHLLPSTENPYVLGVVYDSCTFPQHDRAGPISTRFTVMLGGSWMGELQERLGDLPTDNDVVNIATEAISKHLGLSPELRPFRAEIHLLEDCIPTYTVGHLGRVCRIEEEIKKLRLPIILLGSSYRGVSVNDCILNSRRVAESLLANHAFLS